MHPNKNKIYLYLLFITAYCIFASLSLSEASVSGLELKGTIFTRSAKPIAIIKDTTTGKINMYEVGENIKNAKVIEIKRGEVILQQAGAQYTLALPGGNAAAAEIIDFDIDKKGDIFYISRQEANKAILKAPQMLRDVKLMPNFTKGKPQGIRLDRIKQGSIIERAGVKSGDIVKSINGMTLNTPYQIFQVYKRLKAERNFKVEVLRDNKSVALSYIIE